MWLLPYFNGYWFIRLDSFGHFRRQFWSNDTGTDSFSRHENLKKILDQNALEFLAFGKDLIGDRLRLDILTRILRIIFN